MAENKNAPDDLLLKQEEVKNLVVEGQKKFNETSLELKSLIEAVKSEGAAADAASKARLEAQALKFAEQAEAIAEVKAQQDFYSKSLDRPIYGSDKDVIDFDKKSTQDILLAKHVMSGGSVMDFRAKGDEAISSAAIHTAFNKLMTASSLSGWHEKMGTLTDVEKKSISVSTVGNSFFVPQLLDIVKNCNIVCASLVDLYDTLQVSKPTFKYPVIANYGNLGSYGAAEDCAATFGLDANVSMNAGDVKDWRGAFCMHEDVIRYAAFDFYKIMVESIERSRLITQNQAFITGDGLKEPVGWATSTQYPKFTTSAVGAFNEQDWRMFLAKGPSEFGQLVAVMHPYMLAYLISRQTTDHEFIFNGNDMFAGLNVDPSKLRLSKCLPDATANNSLDGSAGKPFATGAFVSTVADWGMAYKRFVLEPMTVRPNFVTGPYCQQWAFRERSGGEVWCANAAHTLVIG